MGKSVASSAMDYPTEADQRPQRIGRERIISYRKAAERGCKQWLACRQFAALPLQPLWADLRKSRLRNFFGPGNEVHAGGKVDDNANLSHENPGPEETCDVGAIEKLAYDLWLARGCPVGCPEVDWFEAERQLNGTRESSGLSRPATQSQ